jgi:protein-L-isoaspartate(D-aspartate) O-methyltransferase
MEDTYKHKGMRRKLIAEVRAMGITNEQVLEAMNAVPRHYFLSSAFLEYAYQNRAFQIDADQTISQPYTVAFQTSLLDLSPGEKVLEIGTGSGYQTAVLCELKAKVFSIERQKVLFDKAKVLLEQLGYKSKLYFGDGFKGLPVWAPFDKILVTCGAPFIPEALLTQLRIGGKLVIPVDEGSYQIMKEVTRVGDADWEEKKHGKFQFVPMLSDRNSGN